MGKRYCINIDFLLYLSPEKVNLVATFRESESFFSEQEAIRYCVDKTSRKFLSEYMQLVKDPYNANTVWRGEASPVGLVIDGRKRFDDKVYYYEAWMLFEVCEVKHDIFSLDNIKSIKKELNH